MIDQPSFDTLLWHVDALRREVRQLRRELLRNEKSQAIHPARISSLFGSVKAGDITEAMIEEAKRELFQPDDL